MDTSERSGSVDTTALLRAIAEQLKVPLTTIACQAELAGLDGGPPADLAVLQLQSQLALTLVDSYLLGLALREEQAELALEPVSVSSLLTEVAHELSPFARRHEVQVEVSVAGRYEPVMAHRAGLKAALLSLGLSLVGAQAEQGARRLSLATHRTPGGITAGLYGERPLLSTAEWRQALELCGRARQPLTGLTANGAAGVFVADTILQAMAARLRVGRHRNQYGLATTLQPSQQLRLV